MIFVAVIAAAAFIGLGNSGALAPHHDLTGIFELRDTSGSFSSISTTGSDCKGSGGYSDIGPGASVVLKDGEGKILATSFLGTGTGDLVRCSFTFTLSGVPEAPFYTVEVSHRGGISYSLADMRAAGWTLGLSLGS